MESTAQLFERLRASNGGCSDYRLAKLMGTPQTYIIRWTQHGKTMDDEHAIRMAELLAIDPAYVLACMAAERSHSVESSRHWERIAAHFAASVLLALPLMSLIHWRF